MDPAANTSEENRRLRRTMRDLVALSTLPAVWVGLGPEGIARSLADVLLNTLSLDLIYVRLAGLTREGVIEVARSKHRPAAQVDAVRAALTPLLGTDRTEPPATVPDPFGGGTLHVAVTRFGVGEDHGVLVTGSRNSDFPTESDRMLLGVGANQTAIVVQRRRAEEQTEEQRERLRVTLASIGDAVVTTDTEGRVTFLNSVAESLTGWANDEAAGRPLEVVFEIVNEQTRTPVANPVSKVLRDGRVVGLANHTVLIAKDGTERPIDDSAAPIRGKGGEIVGCVLVFRDISEKKRAEAEVRASDERFRTLFESMEEAFCVVEMLYDADNRPADYRFLEANPTFEKHTGFKDAVGRTIRELVPDHDAHWFEIYGRVAATGEATRFVNEARAMGRWYDVYAYRVGGPDSRKVGILFTDITARKKSEAATQFRSEQLRRLAEVATRLNAALDIGSISGVVTEEVRTLIGSHQAVTSFTTDQNWGQAINTVSLSEKYARWRGYSERPDGSGIYSLVCRTNRPLRMTQAELEKHPAYKRFGQHAPDHPPLRGWLAAPLVGRDGRNLGLIQLSDKCEGEFTEEDEAVLVQLAQMASVAIENARLMQDLRDADRRKDEFLATLAHELRNPLAPLRNAIQILKMPRVDAATVGRSREMMERQVQHLVRLVDDLLDMSRVMRGKIVLRTEAVELASVVARAVETAQPLVEAQRHELAIDLPSESLLLEADPVRLAQVVGNLLTNAAKYTEPNGRIRLTARREGDEAVLRLRDSGIGIDPDMLPHVFDLFVQVDHAASRSQGGLGIGLTLVKNLVEMHRGRVEAHSPGLGKGSEFVVRLPLLAQGREEKGDQENGGPSESAPSSGHRLLVVDDNRDAADSLAMLLRLQGHEVRVAHDGPTALQMATAYRPEMVFLDIGMPGMDGYEVARRLRRQPGLENVRLAALTGWGQEEDRRRSKEAGFDNHLVKPPEPKALESVLAELKRREAQ